jgi:hypothetical protein
MEVKIYFKTEKYVRAYGNSREKKTKKFEGLGMLGGLGATSNCYMISVASIICVVIFFTCALLAGLRFTWRE